MSKLLLVFLIFISFVPAKGAESIRLFKENGGAVRDYDEQVQNLTNKLAQNPHEPIDLVFSKGILFRAYSVIGVGGQNVILDIGKQWVLRIRKKRKRFFAPWTAFFHMEDPTVFVDSLGDFYKGIKALEKDGVPVPKMTEIPGHTHEFLILRKLNIDFLYEDYLKSDFVEKLSPEMRIQVDNHFLDFVKKTSRFRNIGDFRSSQLAYTSESGWVLFDTTNNYDLAMKSDSSMENIFEQNTRDTIMNRAIVESPLPQYSFIKKPGLPEHMRAKALETIEQTRVPQCKDLFR